MRREQSRSDQGSLHPQNGLLFSRLLRQHNNHQCRTSSTFQRPGRVDTHERLIRATLTPTLGRLATSRAIDCYLAVAKSG
jgi:hypothetical protein